LLVVVRLLRLIGALFALPLLMAAGVGFGIEFLTGDPRVSLTIGAVVLSASTSGGLEFFWMGGPNVEERKLDLPPKLLSRHAKALALKAAMPACVFAGLLAVALVAAVGANLAGVPLTAGINEWDYGWGGLWFWSTLVATILAMWPGGLVGDALGYLQAAHEARRRTDQT
jgi:hypothetical protein